MTIFNSMSNVNAHSQSSKTSKLLKSTLIVAAASSLLACGQSNTNASDASSAQTESAAVVASNAPDSNANASNATNAAIMTTPVSNPELLKNVSAAVYKDANCGCCKDWISHAEDNGLSTTAHDVADLAVFKERYGVPNDMRSCHTAVTTDGYVFEGHVPVKYVAQFLENPPTQALGLAVPGMPMGSPGMEYQNKFDPYQIMQLNKDGTTEVYVDINSAEQQL